MTAKDEIDTPALCLDLDVLESNCAAVASQCRAAGVAWRPHIKCHRSGTIARMQVEAGAWGVTCATLREAEIMAAAGVDNILIANLIVGPTKLRRLALLRRHAHVTVCVDNPRHVDALAHTFHAEPDPLGVLVEVDIGMQRVGVQPSADAVDLARYVTTQKNVVLQGIMGYEGHLLQVANPHEKAHKIHAALDRLVATAQQIEAASCACPIISCGGTGSYQISIHHAGITEVQAGGAVFMDEFYRTKCGVKGLGNALTCVATVVSCPDDTRAIIDAGRKTLDTQICTPLVLDRVGVEVDYLCAEHGVLRLTPGTPRLAIGQRLELIPGYVDFTTALHNSVHAFRGSTPSGKIRLASAN